MSNTNKYCIPFNYKNETKDVKSQEVENGKIVDKWKPQLIDGKVQYRDTIVVNFVMEEGKAIPNVLSVDNLKAMCAEHEKLQVVEGMKYEKKYQFPKPLEQTLEDDTTILTIGVKYEPMRPKFRSNLNFG
tara:strand:+ start:795 stop:1184 length:390 start_codon:yes stop_codon:yes gene_type:complete